MRFPKTAATLRSSASLVHGLASSLTTTCSTLEWAVLTRSSR